MVSFNHIDSEEVLDYYNNKDNYKIIENNNCNECDTTVVYFSSNGIYFPNTYEEFYNTIKEKDRYEWSKTENQFQYAKKIIYVRDIHKQWYLKGINKDINSFDELAKFIKKHHSSEKLILVGSSAGGYVATIIGTMLKADAVFSFAGQLTLEPFLKEAKEKGKDKLLVELYDKNKLYYNLESLLERSNTDIFYFVCKYSEMDKEDIEIASKYSNIHNFYFDCNYHGIPFQSILLKRVLSTNKEQLISIAKKYNEQLIKPLLFWKEFFNRVEYNMIFSIFIFKNFKKIPKSVFKKIKAIYER